MNGNIFIDAQEVANELGTSKAYAYKLIQKLNEEMKESGFITIEGKINRKFFYEKIYGGGRENVSLQR